MRKYKSNKIPLDAKTAVCKNCKAELSIDNFRLVQSRGLLHYRRVCNSCCTNKYMNKNNEPRLRAQRLCACAMQRSKENASKYKFECDLTPEWIESKIKKGRCEVTNIPFVLTRGHHPFAPSMDRIDSSKGYTMDNIQIVVLIYNTAKRQFCHDDVMLLAKALVNRDI